MILARFSVMELFTYADHIHPLKGSGRVRVCTRPNVECFKHIQTDTMLIDYATLVPSRLKIKGWHGGTVGNVFV
jgi:hypothetical protein